MFLLTIGADNYSEDIIKKFVAQFKEHYKYNNDIYCEDYNVGKSNFAKCGIKENILKRLIDKKALDDFKYQISLILSDVIIKYWEPKLLRKIIKENYYYLNEKEKEKVLDITNQLLDDEKAVVPGGFYRITRRNKIMKCVVEYLGSENTLNIDGFVNFRLGIYLKELNEAMERAIEVFVAEKEYNEFIKLLKYFVDIQECKLDIIHLMQSDDGRYILLDKDKKSINAEYFDELKSDISDGNMNFDDLLISTLITISPRTIYIHDIDSFRNKELAKTIKSVFNERIVDCSGCELCRSERKLGEVKESNKYGL